MPNKEKRLNQPKFDKALADSTVFVCLAFVKFSLESWPLILF